MQDKLKPKHTPGKWHESLGRVCDDRLNGEIAQCSPRGSDACAVMQANARRIVQCCNAHDALVEALTHGIDRASDVVERWESGDLAGAIAALTSWCDVEARAALAAAKVGS